MTTYMPSLRSSGEITAFDPEAAITVMEPEAADEGYWVGCPSVLYEPDRERFLMTYRQRRPRGHPDGERGWRCAVATSPDGVSFSDVWSVTKDELGSASMERFCLLPKPDGYLLYLSYVDPVDNRWRVDVCEAGTPDGFDVRTAQPVLTAASTGTEGVKDPYALRVASAVYLFASFAADAGLDDDARERAHATADIYNTGTTVCPTGLAISSDGRKFDWEGTLLDVGRGWDRYEARLNSVAQLASGAFVGFYDGSSSVAENYEERCGLAVSWDLTTWRRLTVHEPWVVGPYRSGSVRYVDAVTVGDQWWLYYETTRADGAHELRLAQLPRGVGR